MMMRGRTVECCSWHLVEWLSRGLYCLGRDSPWCLFFEAGTGRRFRPQQRTSLPVRYQGRRFMDVLFISTKPYSTNL